MTFRWLQFEILHKHQKLTDTTLPFRVVKFVYLRKYTMTKGNMNSETKIFLYRFELIHQTVALDI